MTFALALAALIGLALGVLGGGGSIVTLPVLVYIAHVPAKEAVAMSMAIVGATSLFGAAIQYRRGNVALKDALVFSVTGMAGSWIGSSGTHLLSKQALMLAFAGLMLVVGGVMLMGGIQASARREAPLSRCLVVGFIMGLLTGFLGVGGGFLIVPALVLTAGLETCVAAGTSLVVIAMNSASGLAGQLRYVRLDVTLLGGFLLFAFAGMVGGLAVARRLNDRLLRRIFAVVLIALALVIGALNL